MYSFGEDKPQMKTDQRVDTDGSSRLLEQMLMCDFSKKRVVFPMTHFVLCATQLLIMEDTQFLTFSVNADNCVEFNRDDFKQEFLYVGAPNNPRLDHERQFLIHIAWQMVMRKVIKQRELTSCTWEIKHQTRSQQYKQGSKQVISDQEIIHRKEPSLQKKAERNPVESLLRSRIGVKPTATQHKIYPQ
jgi:hypothetical protein